MKTTRIISPSDVRLYYFASKEVLYSQDAIADRRKKLERAVDLTHNKQIVSIYLQLPNGEMVEMRSEHLEYSDDFLFIQGGFTIPIGAVIDVEA